MDFLKRIRHWLKNFLFLLLTIFPICLFSQNIDITPESIESIDGISSSYVNSIAQDKFGFIWFGTSAGLDRYDGYEITSFHHDPFDTTSLSNDYVQYLYTDSKNRLWIGTLSGLNLFDYETKKFIRFSLLKNPEQKEWVFSLAETIENGNISLWVGVMEAGLVKVHPENGKTEYYGNDSNSGNSFNGRNILSMHTDKNGYLLIGTHKNGLYKYDPTNNSFKNFKKNRLDSHSISSNHIISIKADTDNNFTWIGTGDGGLNKFDPISEKFISYKKSDQKMNSLNDNRILSIQIVGKFLWLGTPNGGLNIFDTVNENFFNKENYFESLGIFDHLIGNIFQDSSGIIWFATSSKGIFKYDPNLIQFGLLKNNPTNNSGIRENSINQVAKDADGNLLITHPKGVDKYFPKIGKVEPLLNFPSSAMDVSGNIVNAVYTSPEQKEVIWIAPFLSGLIKFNTKTKSISHLKSIPEDSTTLSHSSITLIYEDSRQYLWLGTFTGGLNRLNIRTGTVKRFLHSETNKKSVSDNIIFSIVESDNFLWIGTNSGLNKFDYENESFQKINLNQHSSIKVNSSIGTIHKSNTEKNILWLGTDAGGLIKFNTKNESVKRYTTHDGLTNNVVLKILNDFDGNLWISTNNGLSRFDPRKEEFINFYKGDGLQSNEFNLDCGEIGLDGKLYFGGPNGLNFFSPESIKVDKSFSKIVLTDFLLFNESVKISDSTILHSSMEVCDKIVLGYEDNIFSIKFTSPNFKKPMSLKFAYMLSGFNDNWIITDSQNRIATFSNVPPGEYEFRVKAANALGMWNENYHSLKIDILPPFYRTWWAYLFYSTCFIAVIISVIQWRVYKTNKEKRYLENVVLEKTKSLNELISKKDRFFSIVAHDIKSPLLAVLNFSKIFRDKFNDFDEEEKSEGITDIYNSLSSTYRYINNLLDWSRVQIGRFEFRPENINLINMIERNIEFMSAQAVTKNISLMSKIPEKQFVFADYEMISIIIRNLISNGIKFSYSGRSVVIESRQIDNSIEIIVRDTGIGISDEDSKKLFNIEHVIHNKGTENEQGTGLGLILCKELITKNNGDIFVESQVGKGSSFYFTLPIGKCI